STAAAETTSTPSYTTSGDATRWCPLDLAQPGASGAADGHRAAPSWCPRLRMVVPRPAPALNLGAGSVPPLRQYLSRVCRAGRGPDGAQKQNGGVPAEVAQSGAFAAAAGAPSGTMIVPSLALLVRRHAGRVGKGIDRPIGLCVRGPV